MDILREHSLIATMPWYNVRMSKDAPGVRYAEIYRETAETRIQVVLDLDGGTRRDITTGIGFFDHMLSQLAFHGQFDIGISAEGDLEVDDHHTAEDVGIVLGKALAQALDQSDPIVRYGSNHTPMDEALVLVAVDFSGRGGLFYEVAFTRDKIGELSTECIREFFRALCAHSGITLHIRKIAGENNHHICEAMFKGFGLAMHQATRRSERRGSSSTKGSRD
ncbi:MAG: imidazoleglycerol-phosphate dehydratase HisB [Fimbriimonas sp.]|nr:imidazoleglycerol-phosphate dehydratase HisB [Fimbriimonas sp.]